MRFALNPGAKMSNPLKDYLDGLTAVQRVAFANRAKSSIGSLRLTAAGYRTGGKLVVSSELAGRLAKASQGALTRAQLSPVCAKCPHAK